MRRVYNDKFNMDNIRKEVSWKSSEVGTQLKLKSLQDIPARLLSSFLSSYSVALDL